MASSPLTIFLQARSRGVRGGELKSHDEDALPGLPALELKSAQDKKTVYDHAQHALAVVVKQTLNQQEQQQVVNETVEYWSRHVNIGFLQYRKSVGDSDEDTSVEWREPFAGGIYFQDVRGRVFMDCLGGFGIYNVGHRNPLVLRAVQAQLHKQALHSQELLDPLRTYCAQLISLITPGAGLLKNNFFVNSGTEAVEASIKLALLSTGRKHIISTINAFHGKTLGSLSATSKACFRQPFLNSLLNVTHVPLDDIHMLRTMFASARHTGNDVAGLILEPIQGEGGIHVASNEYLREARRLCDEYGSVLIFDEVQTGMGRTGKWFGCMHAEVVPDVMAIGKAFGGGVMPAGACVARDWVWTKYVENPFLFTTTFGGNPLAMAAAIATINVIIKDNLLDRTVSNGSYMISGLNKLQKKYPRTLREVRGRGLMIGLEFTTNNNGIAFSKGMFNRNILVSGTLSNALVVRVEPPLTISKDEIDVVLSTADEVCAEIERVEREGLQQKQQQQQAVAPKKQSAVGAAVTQLLSLPDLALAAGAARSKL